ncbi:DUF2163 domain-containing protein [Methylobacterium aerolatum]|uniref:Phage protein (TIGR02218 family) n=1 Tax=Methylobacterium aerolatum TaxID=418708 RepID=A0ABU0I5A3_9HYPH|nr:DUF2163 domain-containing protein [Methylobacterium aerolatum]MDQ0448841.1 putative phage protein (TIGR02218 family) [Methylobacterium aerolatum]GJD34205.1 hypothetical protein FMGBMHLM_1101 [Methylobacterium aerolatum]
MKTVSPGLSASLAAGVTTLCTCWIVTRRDGTVLGFTDHDADLVVEGVACLAESGVTASALEQSAGLAVDGMTLMGALTGDRLGEDDLARGLFDGARLSAWRVDWQTPADRVQIFAGTIGEVSRGRTAFQAEVRSLTNALNQPRGRLYGRSCEAAFGDGRCGVDASLSAYRSGGTVTRLVSGRSFAASGLAAYAPGWFSAGTLTWLTGRNAGAVQEVRTHLGRESALLDLWEPTALAMAPGDTFTIVAGCDRTFESCRGKFGNAANFRGFPHLPGSDYAMTYARPGAQNDGGRLD